MIGLGSDKKPAFYKWSFLKGNGDDEVTLLILAGFALPLKPLEKWGKLCIQSFEAIFLVLNLIPCNAINAN